MKEKKYKNLPVYTILAIIFALQVAMFFVFKNVRDTDMEYSQSHTYENMRLLERINKLEEKLNLDYNVETKTYQERTAQD